MPPRKEPKETVIYAASKRKPLPFKPQRPSKVPRISTTESESSATAGASKRTTPAKQKAGAQQRQSNERETDQEVGIDDSDEELADNPLAAKPRPASKAKPQAAKRKPSRAASPPPLSDEEDDLPQRPAVDDDTAPLPSQNDSPSIPQPLLIRLLHEHFADKSTKIDKHAIQVLQKYVEVFVREAIARTALQKKQDAEDGGVSVVDVGWLELEDLEKVAGGMMLDF